MKQILRQQVALLSLLLIPGLVMAKGPAPHSEPSSGHAKAANHSAPHAAPADGVAPEIALGWLKNGNARFKKGFLRKDGQAMTDVERLSQGQKPHTIVLSCSDSRVPPEVVFDQKLGEIFVVRTAGQSLGDSVIGSIEYSVAHLGTKLIVVMGHTQCGAVKATLAYIKDKEAPTPSLSGMLKDIEPRLMSHAKKPASDQFLNEAKTNTEGVAKDLTARSPIIAEKVKAGELRIVTSVYHLGTGNVDFAD